MRGALSFWTFQPEFLQRLSHEVRLDYLRKASFEKSHVRKFLNGDPDSGLREIKVQRMTLTHIDAMIDAKRAGRQITRDTQIATNDLTSTV